MKIIKVMGLNVFSDDLSEIEMVSCKSLVINTISPNSYGISTKNKSFRKAIIESDYLVLDGVYFGLASLLISGKKIKVNNGPTVFNYFINKMNKEQGKIFFLGSSRKTLERIYNRVTVEFPHITVGTFSPPYKSRFSSQDSINMFTEINRFKPDIIFIGMTCPKQEKWAEENKYKLNAGIVCSVGAVFDWYSGNQKLIHPLWWKFRLAWLKRTVDRPEILKRYPDIGIFFRDLLLVALKFKKIS